MPAFNTYFNQAIFYFMTSEEKTRDSDVLFNSIAAVTNGMLLNSN